MTCLLERELNNVKKGNAPLIEMEFLGEMVERYTGMCIATIVGILKFEKIWEKCASK